MAESSVEPRKEEEEEEVEEEDGFTDRISSLPDCILCHILSFLPSPTITSVRTMSLVSRRWRHLWKQLQVFLFIDENDDVDFNDFPLFVNTVLTLRRFPKIRKFCLVLCFEFPDWENMFKSWVRTATGPYLEELELSIPYANSGMLELPPSLFINCNNLVSLCLAWGVQIQMKVQDSSLHFPSLKNLILCSFDNVNPIVSFLSACPVLETLEMPFYNIDISLTKVPVPPSSSSNRLKSTNHNFNWTYFELDIDPRVTLGIIGNFNSMVEVFLDVISPGEDEFVDPILKDIRDYKYEISLLSRHLTSKWPLSAPVLSYPEFHKLDHLKFILPCFNSNLLVHVLEKCHKLRVLIIQSSKEEPPPLRTWQPESTVSECLKSHLTYVHIEGYQGLEDELTFVEYILRNGLVLETMLIFFDISMDKTNKDCSFKRLSEIPMGSATCQLKFNSVISP